MNSAKLKLLSKLGPRAVFGKTLMAIAKEDNNVLLVTADVSTSAGLDRFRKNLPNQYVDVGIAEQNMIGVASGLAFSGFTVYTTTFAPFQTLRCCEQIKINCGYMKNKLIMVGLSAGVALGELGYTHCSIEDIAVMRSIPNITITCPADCFELQKILYASREYKEPMYIRLTGESNMPIVYDKDYDYKIGLSNTLRSGNDISIIGTGNILNTALRVAERLHNTHGLSTEVINYHTIKPLDNGTLERLYKSRKLLVSIEEHSTIGGLGGAIAEHKSHFQSPPLLKMGLKDSYCLTGNRETILEKAGLDEDSVVERILNYRF